MTVDTALRTRERIAELVGDIETIATLPEVTSRIMAIVHDPKSTAADLHRVISHDPSLVSRILKLVNSSFYARRTEIDSVERAVVLLGFHTVYNVAISATLGELFTNACLGEDFTARDLWTHSVAVAAASREIARRVCKPMAEQAFLAGLMHDVGLLVELQVCPDKLSMVCEAAKSGMTPFSAVELDLIGCSHAELGAALADKWGFPAYCRAAAGCHHYPWLAEPEQRQMAAIVSTADTLCCQDAIGFDLTAKWQVADTVGFGGLVPLDAIEYAQTNLPQLISDAIMVFSR